MAKRRLIGGLILGIALTSAATAQPPTSAVIGTPPQPSWGQLNPQQKNILAPLSREWDQLENIRKRKWLGIAERYPTMKPDEQQRMQDRMREWSDLSAAERTKARNTYKDFKQLPPDQKLVLKQKWDAYSNLSSDEKQRIRESGKSSKLLTPSPAAEPVQNTISDPMTSPETRTSNDPLPTVGTSR